jgi:hypothetical protein
MEYENCICNCTPLRHYTPLRARLQGFNDGLRGYDNLVENFSFFDKIKNRSKVKNYNKGFSEAIMSGNNSEEGALKIRAHHIVPEISEFQRRIKGLSNYESRSELLVEMNYPSSMIDELELLVQSLYDKDSKFLITSNPTSVCNNCNEYNCSGPSSEWITKGDFDSSENLGIQIGKVYTSKELIMAHNSTGYIQFDSDFETFLEIYLG